MIITNVKIIPWNKPNEIIKNHAVLLKQDVIEEVGIADDIIRNHPGEYILDGNGQLLMPGSICAHTHFYGAFSRGMAIPGFPPKDFPEILQKLWWPLDQSLDEESVKYSALVCIIDAIKHGTTTLMDHHASPGCIDGSLDIIADSVDLSGIRASLCYEVTDRGSEEKTNQGIAENVRFIKRVKQGDNLKGRLSSTFGLHASLTLSDQTLEKCAGLVPPGAGFHIHVAEHEVDEYDSLQKSGYRVVDRLQKFGIIGEKSILVHAVHVDVKEIQLLAESRSWVTHQPRSNMNNAVGIAPIESMMRAGVRVGLGNDGFSNAMWEEWKTVYLVHKLWNKDPRRMSAIDVVEMAIYNNSTLATEQFELPVGKITPGAQADLILVDYHPYTELNSGNLPWHMIFGFHESMVTTTIVAGKVLMKDRKLLTLDEEEITANARSVSQKTWQKYQNYF